MLEDGGFKIPSANAANARTAAVKLQEWTTREENATVLQSFAAGITARLNTAFDSGAKQIKRQREKMWAKYHSIRTSSDFLSQWSCFTSSVLGEPATLTLTQHLTDLMFKQLIQQQFPQEESSGAESDLPALSLHEQNALRYAAGYVCRNLRRKLERSSHPLKEELVVGIMDLLNCEDDNDDKEEACSETWLNTVDRGGLWHVSDETFMVFQSMEEVVRQHFRKWKVRSLSSGGKQALVSKISTDEDVRFYWCIVAADFGEAEEKILLDMIIDLWITVRGFAFVSGWIEQYKQSKKKSLQKSKGLRSGLFSSSSKD